MSRVRGSAVPMFVVSLLLAAFGLSVFFGGTSGQGRHWAAAPLLAVAIILTMGCLVALATTAGVRRQR